MITAPGPERPMALELGDLVKFHGTRFVYRVVGHMPNRVVLARNTQVLRANKWQDCIEINWQSGIRFPAGARTNLTALAKTVQFELDRAEALDIDWVERDGVRTQAGIYAEGVTVS